MRSYGASKIGPIAGYDVFLNQRFSPRLLGANSAHEIDFPFAFQYHGLFDEFSTLEGVRSGTFVEAHTMSLLSKSQLKELEFFGPIRTTSQATADIIKSLNSSKYFLRLGGRRLWGNSMVEAVACGALAIGNPGEYKNRSLFSNATKAPCSVTVNRKAYLPLVSPVILVIDEVGLSILALLGPFTCCQL